MRRGSFLSRLVALLILASPFLVAGGILARPLYERWAAEGADILQFRARNVALAREDARMAEIEALASDWRAFAADPRSGLSQKPLIQTYEDILAQTQLILNTFGGAFVGAEITDPHTLGGLEVADMTIRLDLPSANLTPFLAAFEAATPQLTLNMMHAEAPSGRRSGPPRLKLALGGRLHRLSAHALQFEELADAGAPPSLEAEGAAAGQPNTGDPSTGDPNSGAPEIEEPDTEASDGAPPAPQTDIPAAGSNQEDGE